MKALWLLGSWLLSVSALNAIAQDLGAGEENTRRFLKSESTRLDPRFLEGITNRATWEARRPALKEEFMEMLGLNPLPPRTPLQTQITGVIEQQNYRIEKLHFQSRPHLYVTGNLFLPKNIKEGEKLPAVLYVCGHSGRGRDGNKTAFQHHGAWFATHGYVCLIIDTLQLGEIAGIHHGTYRYDRWWWQARGYTPAGVECWNGIRALDYLQSRPEVDAERLGVTGISGGGAATFWIAAADDRVKVAVPVSGMADLEEYVGEKVVNGHCDCMFMINTFQWPWTHIAALLAPRPFLFENSGHDTIFPMPANERIRARIEKLYSFYTNRTDRLFDIGVTPGGHDDKPELRLMAYRWLNHFLRKEDGPVTEPDLPTLDGPTLRAFPGELPADELNSRIDESFVPMNFGEIPSNRPGFASWRQAKLEFLRSRVFRGVADGNDRSAQLPLRTGAQGMLGVAHAPPVAWKYLPGEQQRPGLIVVLGPNDPVEKPAWAARIDPLAPVLLVSPIGAGSQTVNDPPPHNIKRSLALLGKTIESCQVAGVLAAARAAINAHPGNWRVAGSGAAGVIGLYAALFDPSVSEVLLVNPPASHREGPIFLNVMRELDIPDACALFAPRSLVIFTSKPAAFARAQAGYRTAGGPIRIEAGF